MASFSVILMFIKLFIFTVMTWRALRNLWTWKCFLYCQMEKLLLFCLMFLVYFISSCGTRWRTQSINGTIGKRQFDVTLVHFLPSHHPHFSFLRPIKMPSVISVRFIPLSLSTLSFIWLYLPLWYSLNYKWVHTWVECWSQEKSAKYPNAGLFWLGRETQRTLCHREGWLLPHPSAWLLTGAQEAFTFLWHLTVPHKTEPGPVTGS